VVIYYINGYWWLSILLMAFSGYYINGYWWLSILLMLLVAIILMAIGGYLFY
jgi:hypothetical protein